MKNSKKCAHRIFVQQHQDCDDAALGGFGTLVMTLWPNGTAWPIVIYCTVLAIALLSLSSIVNILNTNDFSDLFVVGLS
jgi:hypothetical protein